MTNRLLINSLRRQGLIHDKLIWLSMINFWLVGCIHYTYKTQFKIFDTVEDTHYNQSNSEKLTSKFYAICNNANTRFQSIHHRISNFRFILMCKKFVKCLGNPLLMNLVARRLYFKQFRGGFGILMFRKGLKKHATMINVMVFDLCQKMT